MKRASTDLTGFDVTSHQASRPAVAMPERSASTTPSAVPRGMAMWARARWRTAPIRTSATAYTGASSRTWPADSRAKTLDQGGVQRAGESFVQAV